MWREIKGGRKTDRVREREEWAKRERRESGRGRENN